MTEQTPLTGPDALSFDWPALASEVVAMERAGLVTRTFRRLDPERQTAVLHAIVEEAAERGPAGLSIKQVARRAEVSVGSLYQYFGSREHMLTFTIDVCVRHAMTVLEVSRLYLVEMPLREGLTAYIQGGCDWAAQEPGLSRLFARAAYQGDPDLSDRLVLPVSVAMRGLVREILECARARGEIREDINLEASASAIHAFSIVLGDSRLLPHLDAYFQLSPPGLDPSRMILEGVDLILRGLEPRERGAQAAPAARGRRPTKRAPAESTA